MIMPNEMSPKKNKELCLIYIHIYVSNNSAPLLFIHLCILVNGVEGHLRHLGEVLETARLLRDLLLDRRDQLGHVRVPSQLGQHPGVSEEKVEEESEGESSNQHLGYRHLLFCEEERVSWSRIHLVPLPSLNDNTLRILSRLDRSVWQRADELGRGVRLFRVVHFCGVGKRDN